MLIWSVPVSHGRIYDLSDSILRRISNCQLGIFAKPAEVLYKTSRVSLSSAMPDYLNLIYIACNPHLSLHLLLLYRETVFPLNCFINDANVITNLTAHL